MTNKIRLWILRAICCFKGHKWIYITKDIDPQKYDCYCCRNCFSYKNKL